MQRKPDTLCHSGHGLGEVKSEQGGEKGDRSVGEGDDLVLIVCPDRWGVCLEGKVEDASSGWMWVETRPRRRPQGPVRGKSEEGSIVAEECDPLLLAELGNLPADRAG